MTEKNTTRIDKWLWAVRIFKTRTLANEACSGGRVKIGGKAIKPSRNLASGEIIQVRKGAVKYEFKVLKLAEKRMNAKLVPEFMEDITPVEEAEKLTISKSLPVQTRKRGEGRPTKRERRKLDKLREKF
jgi:ribosome-associated heat shock protein Hsp15